jgi:cytochrome c oxidase cbb3-type subunit III
MTTNPPRTTPTARTRRRAREQDARTKTPQDPETTGHSWDGIEEYNNPLPRWWLWTFYATIIWGIGYTILFPAWPIDHASHTRAFSASRPAPTCRPRSTAATERNAALTTGWPTVELASITDDPEIYGFAVNKGGAIFRSHCSQCHGAGRGGGGGLSQPAGRRLALGRHAGRDRLHDHARHPERTVARHALVADAGLRRDPRRPTKSCPSCITFAPSRGRSMTPRSRRRRDGVPRPTAPPATWTTAPATRFQGAPNLTNAIWLYGGDMDSLIQTVTYSRFGVMPAWSRNSGPRRA